VIRVHFDPAMSPAACAPADLLRQHGPLLPAGPRLCGQRQGRRRKRPDPALYLCHRNVEFSRESTARTPIVSAVYYQLKRRLCPRCRRGLSASLRSYSNLVLLTACSCASRPHLYRDLHFSVLDLTKQRLLTPYAFWEVT
jgi:RNase P subunit RPR2